MIVILPELEIKVKDDADKIFLDVFQETLTNRLNECVPKTKGNSIKTELKKTKRIPVNCFDKKYDVVLSNYRRKPITIGKLLIQYMKDGSIDEENSDEPKHFLFFQATYKGKIPYPETNLHLYVKPLIPFMKLSGYQEKMSFTDTKYGKTSLSKEEIFRNSIQEELYLRQDPPYERLFSKRIK